ncbi:MAG TPA: type II CAAX endopeptidase family protein [Polyangiaceae bacterium]|nr:type II CAAX endopeptidase family protein [Polyangiaceae bacterium]
MKSAAWIGTVVAVLTAAFAYAVRPGIAGSPGMWIALGLPYLLLAGLGLVQLARRGRLTGLLAYRRGDPSIGILVGLVMLAAAWLFARQWLHTGASARAWLFSILLLAGDPSWVPGSLLLFAVVICEEVVWRGWLQLELHELLGPRRAWIACALLYAAVHTPTLFTLEDATAGKNPLLLIAALGGGGCWSFLVARTERLLPGLIAHGVFTYFATHSLWMLV